MSCPATHSRAAISPRGCFQSLPTPALSSCLEWGSWPGSGHLGGGHLTPLSSASCPSSTGDGWKGIGDRRLGERCPFPRSPPPGPSGSSGVWEAPPWAAPHPGSSSRWGGGGSPRGRGTGSCPRCSGRRAGTGSPPDTRPGLARGAGWAGEGGGNGGRETLSHRGQGGRVPARQLRTSRGRPD